MTDYTHRKFRPRFKHMTKDNQLVMIALRDCKEYGSYRIISNNKVNFRLYRKCVKIDATSLASHVN